MKKVIFKFLSILLILTLVISLIDTLPVISLAASGAITDADGWFESAYAEWTAVSGADGYNAYVAEADSAAWTKLDGELIREYQGYYRVDAVGLKAGDYRLRIVPTAGGAELNDKALLTDSLKVMAYDRSGYAHYDYTEGVGAYNDDGTLKDNAIVIYVTNENKNTVSVTSKDGTTVTGIGNILGSTGMEARDGLNSKGGKANTNQGIIRKLAEDGTPLVVRIIGSVKGASSTNLPSAISEIDGLTAYNSIDYGGGVGDNGFMARMSGGKNITIEGVGNDATIDGWGLHFICQTADYAAGYGRSFEVRNITFKNVPEDCVGMEGQQVDTTLTAPVERCWVHHCSFIAPVIINPAESDKAGGDGACDFKRGQYFTNSYCYYESYHKTNLVGSSDASLQYNLTYHHNHWYKCESRGPLARQANIHMYNNIFEGQSSYCMNPRANAYIFSEYNLFLYSKNVVTLDSGGVVKSYNDYYSFCMGDNGATAVDDRATTVKNNNKYSDFDVNAKRSYIPSGDYVIQESLVELKRAVMAYAGAQHDVITSPEDVDVSIIPSDRKPTSAITLPYSQSLNKTYLAANGTKDNIVFNVSKFNADSLSVGGNADGADIVFYVNTAVNVTMTAVSGTYSPALCNEAGEVIILGSGSAELLPAGYYMIQSYAYDTGSGKFKEAKIASLTVKAAIDCTNHAYESHTVAPTCTEDGYTTHTCTKCGYYYTDTPVSALGHTPGADATCKDAQICTVCKTVLTPKLSHSYVDGVCSGCGAKQPTVMGHTHSFTKDGWTSDFFTFTGDQLTTGKHGKYTYDFGLGAEALDNAIKFDSKGSVTFTTAADGTLTIAVASNSSGRTILLNGEKIADIDSAYQLTVVTVEVKANVEYTLKRGSGESALYYINYTPSTDSGNPDDNPGVDNPGEDNPGGDNPGGDNPGEDNPGEDNPGGDNPGGDNPGEDNPGGEDNEQKNRFIGISLLVGEDLSIRYYVAPSTEGALEDYSVRFTVNGRTVIVYGAERDGAYVFSFCGITPQRMGDSVKAELLSGDTVLDEIDGYSVKQYAIDALTLYNATEYTEAKYVALRNLLSDMLNYGSKAQEYKSYKTDALVTDGIEELLETSSYTPTSLDKQMRIITANGADISLAKFTAAGVRFDYNNRIFVKFTAANPEKVTLTVDGEAMKIIPLGNDEYIAYSDEISATEYSETIAFELSYNGKYIQTFIYSVNDYVLQKQYDKEIGELVLALYRYGRSALAYEGA